VPEVAVGCVTVAATDESVIKADAGGFAIAVSAGTGASTSTLKRNDDTVLGMVNRHVLLWLVPRGCRISSYEKYGVAAPCMKIVLPSSLSTSTSPVPAEAVGCCSKNTRTPCTVLPSLVPSAWPSRFCTVTSTSKADVPSYRALREARRTFWCCPPTITLPMAPPDRAGAASQVRVAFWTEAVQSIRANARVGSGPEWPPSVGRRSVQAARNTAASGRAAARKCGKAFMLGEG